ncbi:hypothetical protein EWM64_g2131 [Hericium alpestre]|uniref:Uncharacterized protein n=1 Tax=Hericium alpestre TaxID=135208 RepID=A0A4Z0A5Z9_9AGAM|nr:hypothetical protein EWM64_g2131 [Hericium alpestre]
MANSDSLQKSLLTGKWDGAAEAEHGLVDLGRAVTEGRFRDVLTSHHARALFSISDASRLQEEPLDKWFTFQDPSVKGAADLELVRLLVAVACLNAFVQANWTGPDLDVKPLDMVTIPEEASSIVTEDLLHRKAVAELTYGGEPVYHLAQAIPLFRFARILLDLPFQHLITIDWWRLRTWNIHQQILDEPVPIPSESLIPLEDLAEKLDDPDLVGQLWLERGLEDHYQGNDKAVLGYFVRAARATQLQYELTGALGRRTKFQQTDLSQLVLLAQSRQREDNPADRSERNGQVDVMAPAKAPDNLALNDDTLLEQTEFTSSNPAAPGSSLSHLDPSAQPALHPVDQCILLSLCLNVRNTSPSHGLTNEQMSPYIARVISHSAVTMSCCLQ